MQIAPWLKKLDEPIAVQGCGFVYVTNNKVIIYRGDNQPLKYFLLEECVLILSDIATLDRDTSPKIMTG